MDVRPNGPLTGHPASLLVCTGQSLLSQVLRGLLNVVVVGSQRALAVHHARPTALAQLLHQLSVYLHARGVCGVDSLAAQLLKVASSPPTAGAVAVAHPSAADAAGPPKSPS